MNGSTRMRDLRLVPLALAVWGMALVCVFLPAVAWWCAGITGVGGLAMLGLMARQSGAADQARGGLLVVLTLVMAAAAVTAGFAGPERAAAAELDGRVIEIVAEVSSSSSVGSDGRLWFDVQSEYAGTPGSPDALSVPMRVGVERIPDIELGALVRVTGQSKTTDAGERSALVVFGTTAEIVEPARGIFGVAAYVREQFVARAVALPEPGAGLLPGLAVGDTRAVSEELDAAMLSSGLSHLTAVSGQDFRHRSPSP